MNRREVFEYEAYQEAVDIVNANTPCDTCIRWSSEKGFVVENADSKPDEDQYTINTGTGSWREYKLVREAIREFQADSRKPADRAFTSSLRGATIGMDP